MSNLDLFSIFFTGAIVGIICAFVITALWRQNRGRFAGMGLWSLDFALQSIGLLLIVLRSSIPDWMSTTLANTLVLSGAILGLVGLERFVGKKSSQMHNYLLAALFIPLHAYLTFVRPDLELRGILISLALLIVCVQCAWLLLHRVQAPLRRLTRWPGMVFLAYCLLFFFRIALQLRHPVLGNDFFHSGKADAIAFAAILMLPILLTYSLSLMVNGRLQMDLKTQEQKFSKAFHSSPFAIIITRLADNRVFEVNEGFLKITGYPLHEVLGRTIVDLRLWAHIEKRTVIIGDLLRGMPIRGIELEFMRKSGERFTGLYSADLVAINGESCILSSISDISERKLAEQERERLFAEREKVLSEIKVLSGLLPICASCKKIRDDKGYWNQIEHYIEQHSDAEFSHGICPDCKRTLYPDFAGGEKKA